MKPLKIKLVLTILIVLLPILTNSQTQENNIITIEEIYSHVIVNEISNAKNLVCPSLDYKRADGNSDYSFPILNSKIVKNIITDFKNEWEFLMFSNIIITEIDNDNILVTGIISGKNMEKGMINYMPFQHTWLLQNGVVIKFIQ